MKGIKTVLFGLFACSMMIISSCGTEEASSNSPSTPSSETTSVTPSSSEEGSSEQSIDVSSSVSSEEVSSSEEASSEELSSEELSSEDSSSEEPVVAKGVYLIQQEGEFLEDNLFTKVSGDNYSLTRFFDRGETISIKEQADDVISYPYIANEQVEYPYLTNCNSSIDEHAVVKELDSEDNEKEDGKLIVLVPGEYKIELLKGDNKGIKVTTSNREVMQMKIREEGEWIDLERMNPQFNPDYVLTASPLGFYPIGTEFYLRWKSGRPLSFTKPPKMFDKTEKDGMTIFTVNSMTYDYVDGDGNEHHYHYINGGFQISFKRDMVYPYGLYYASCFESDPLTMLINDIPVEKPYLYGVTSGFIDDEVVDAYNITLHEGDTFKITYNDVPLPVEAYMNAEHTPITDFFPWFVPSVDSFTAPYTGRFLINLCIEYGEDTWDFNKIVVFCDYRDFSILVNDRYDNPWTYRHELEEPTDLAVITMSFAKDDVVRCERWFADEPYYVNFYTRDGDELKNVGNSLRADINGAYTFRITTDYRVIVESIVDYDDENTKSIPLSLGEFLKDGAKVYAWAWTDGVLGHWYALDEGNESVTIPQWADKLLIARFNPEISEPSFELGPDMLWNQSPDLEYQEGKTLTFISWSDGMFEWL